MIDLYFYVGIKGQVIQTSFSLFMDLRQIRREAVAEIKSLANNSLLNDGSCRFSHFSSGTVVHCCSYNWIYNCHSNWSCKGRNMFLSNKFHYSDDAFFRIKMLF